MNTCVILHLHIHRHTCAYSKPNLSSTNLNRNMLYILGSGAFEMESYFPIVNQYIYNCNNWLLWRFFFLISVIAKRLNPVKKNEYLFFFLYTEKIVCWTVSLANYYYGNVRLITKLSVLVLSHLWESYFWAAWLVHILNLPLHPQNMCLKQNG